MVNEAATAAFARALRAEAGRLGFAACGFAPAEENPLTAQRLEQWLGEGLHGSMDWMEDPRSEIWSFPRGMQRHGNAGPASFAWTSRPMGARVDLSDRDAVLDAMDEPRP